MGDEQKGNEVLSNDEREAARHVQQSGEQAVRASAPPPEPAAQQGQAAPQADPARVEAAAAEVHAELQRRRHGAPEGASAGLTVPPELVDQLQSLSQQAIAFLISLALRKLGSA